MMFPRRRMIAEALLVLAVTLPAVGWAAPQAAAGELAALRTACDAARLRYEAECVQSQSNAVTAYGKALAETLQTLRRKGDLDAYLAVENEQKRFATAGTVPAETAGLAAPQLVEQYRAALAMATEERARKNAGLQQLYATKLEALMKNLMVQDRIDDAKQVKAELEQVRRSLPPDPAAPKAGVGATQPAAKPDTPPAAAAAPQHAVLLTVNRVKTATDAVTKKENVSAKTYHDASGKQWVTQPVPMNFLYASQTLDIVLRNTSADADAFTVECLFFQQDAATEKPALCGRKKMDLELKPDAVKTLNVKSAELRSSCEKLSIENKMQRIGDKVYGYIVILSDSNGIFKAAASKEHERLLKDKDALAEVVKNGRLPE